MDVYLPPGLYLIFGAALLPLVPRGVVRQVWIVGVALVAFAQVVNMPQGFTWQWEIFDWRLLLVRADALSQAFAMVFGIAAVAAAAYSLYLRDTLQQAAALTYAGAALLAVYAGDLVTLFIGWELTALASVFLVWAKRDERSWGIGLRYLLVQVTSGLLLLAGILMLQQGGDTIRFEWLGTGSAAGILILAAFAVKGAFPLLHGWLTEAYPEATETGTVFMSLFTTKLAMYALIRGYAGTDALVWIGVAGALYALARMALENDARRVVCWALIVQLGIITSAVGVGGNGALTGAAMHAFAGIFYIGLMMMALGAVRLRTGTMRLDELGGLYREMPVTAWMCFIGAAALSAVPPFAGYLSKSIVFGALADGPQWVYAALMFAGVGVFLITLRLVWTVFLEPARSRRAAPLLRGDSEAPLPMIAAMTVMATLCVLFALFPSRFLDMLPWAVEVKAWQAGELASQFAILGTAFAAFLLLHWTGRLPRPLRTPLADFDWLYARGLPLIAGWAVRTGAPLWRALLGRVVTRGRWLFAAVHRHHGPHGTLAATWPTGSMVLWVAVILALALLFYYL